MLDRTGSGLSQHTLDLRFIPRLHEILHAQDRHRQLDRNFNAQVLDTENNPIPGLYAAGEVAFTGLFGDEYPCCGMAIGGAVYYGRIAGQLAAANK